MMYSENWVTWKTNIGPATCDACLSRDKKIFSVDELIERNEPPLHPNCKCERIPMGVIKAGNATNLGTNGVDWWIRYLNELPDYYVTKDYANQNGWISKKGNLSEVLPGKMIYGGIYYNENGVLPQKESRIWYEADINYTSGYRNRERVLFSNDGLIFVTYDHYDTFFEITGEEY